MEERMNAKEMLERFEKEITKKFPDTELATSVHWIEFKARWLGEFDSPNLMDMGSIIDCIMRLGELEGVLVGFLMKEGNHITTITERMEKINPNLELLQKENAFLYFKVFFDKYIRKYLVDDVDAIRNEMSLLGVSTTKSEIAEWVIECIKNYYNLALWSQLPTAKACGVPLARR